MFLSEVVRGEKDLAVAAGRKPTIYLSQFLPARDIFFIYKELYSNEDIKSKN